MSDSKKNFNQVEKWFSKLIDQNHEDQLNSIKELVTKGELDNQQAELLGQLLDSNNSSELTNSTELLSRKIFENQNLDTLNLINQQVNQYQIIKILGRGGMGQVYLAERNDGTFEQKVALKIPTQNFDEEMRRRFENERQILAQLSHNNIARLLDGGTSDDGHPFLAMEYVEGQSIDKYFINNVPSLKSRIELIIQACEAVSFAHQNLVLHRDLKPANILVTNDGTVKLLDFGIAKLFDPENEVRANQTATQIMTRNYASPEQIQGKPVSTQSDLFSLAIIAYELITGFHPFQHESQLEREQNLISGMVMRSTHRTDSSKAVFPALTKVQSSRIKGDLENILLKALSVDLKLRYSSVQAFSDDLHNFLANKPVKARRPGALYTFSKLVQRNKANAFLTLLMLVSLLTSTFYSIHKAQIAEEQRSIAEDQRQLAVLESEKSKQISDFLETLFISARPAENKKEVTIVSLLDNAIEELSTNNSLDGESRFHLMAIIFQSYVSLEKIASLKNSLEGVYQNCVMSLSERNKSCIQIKFFMARYKLEASENEEALRLFKEVEAELRINHEKETKLLARTLINQFTCLINLKDFDKAEKKARQAFLLYDSMKDTNINDLIETKIDVTYALVFNKNFDLSQKYIDEMEAQMKSKAMENTKLYSDWLILKAVYFSMQNQPSKAVIYRKQSVDLINELYPDKKPESFAFRVRALANLYFRLAQLDLALEYFDKAIDLFSAGTDGKELDIIRARLLKALVYLANNQNQRAEQEYEMAKSLISPSLNIDSRIKCQSYFIDAYFGIETLKKEHVDALVAKYVPCTKTKVYNFYNTYLSILNIKRALKTSQKEPALSHLQEAWKLWSIHPETYLGVKKHVELMESEVHKTWPDL